ncbi:MAG: AzlC family ABC transporter permease [Bdellovibrionales bacterium]|jgi:predicted branched-subunit amino acid permease|nr:AzlC family ABC transporter permease [Bdellovibrionales bacterium]
MKKNFFRFGFLKILPIMSGVVPFGAVVGSAASEAGLSVTQSMLINIFVFAGASQLAAVDLMRKDATIAVVVFTGLIINLRFLLYSAAITPTLHGAGFWTRFFGAYLLTDQSYAVMSAHEKHFKTSADAIQFYFGACACMVITWHFSVLAGTLFGNFAPRNWALDYAVPLSFVALVIPTLKDRKYTLVAICSALCGILLYRLPLNVGLILSALIAIGLAVVISRKAEQ